MTERMDNMSEKPSENISRKKLKEYWGNKFYNERHAEFEITGDMALFSDPLLSSGGELTTYSIPTYEAIENICKNIYWKPTFIWVVDKIRIMNRISTEQSGRKMRLQNADRYDLANYTYLTNVRYKVQTHL